MRYATREEKEREKKGERTKTEKERDFFPKRQFTVKLLGEAWRILRGVQQVVGCNKLLPATRLALSMPCRISSVRMTLSLLLCASRDARVLGFNMFHMAYFATISLKLDKDAWSLECLKLSVLSSYTKSVLHISSQRIIFRSSLLLTGKIREYKCYLSFWIRI